MRAVASLDASFRSTQTPAARARTSAAVGVAARAERRTVHDGPTSRVRMTTRDRRAHEPPVGCEYVRDRVTVRVDGARDFLRCHTWTRNERCGDLGCEIAR